MIIITAVLWIQYKNKTVNDKESHFVIALGLGYTCTMDGSAKIKYEHLYLTCLSQMKYFTIKTEWK